MRIRHAHGISVQRQSRDRTERNASAIDVGEVEFHRGVLAEVRETAAGVCAENRRLERRTLLVDGTEAELVVGRPLHAAGVGDVVKWSPNDKFGLGAVYKKGAT